MVEFPSNNDASLLEDLSFLETSFEDVGVSIKQSPDRSIKQSPDRSIHSRPSTATPTRNKIDAPNLYKRIKQLLSDVDFELFAFEVGMFLFL